MQKDENDQNFRALKTKPFNVRRIDRRNKQPIRCWYSCLILMSLLAFPLHANDSESDVLSESAADETIVSKKVESEGPDPKRAEGEGESSDNIAGQMTGAFGGQSRFRGTMINLQQGVGFGTFSRSLNLSYNPNVTSVITFLPRFWLSDVFNIGATAWLTYEWTNSDITTRQNQALLSDITLWLRATNFAQVPKLKLNLNAALYGVIPSSLASQGATLRTRIGGLVGVNRAFPLGKGGTLILSGSVLGGRQFHAYTTGENDSTLDTGCRDAFLCGIYANTGVRNAAWELSPRFAATWAAHRWFGLTASAGVFVNWLRPWSEDVRVSQDDFYQEQNTNTRYLNFVDVGVYFPLHPAATVQVGISSFHQQLRPDGQYRRPWLNRNSQVYVSLTSEMSSFFSLFKSKDELTDDNEI